MNTIKVNVVFLNYLSRKFGNYFIFEIEITSSTFCKNVSSIQPIHRTPRTTVVLGCSVFPFFKPRCKSVAHKQSPEIWLNTKLRTFGKAQELHKACIF
jgi:hypothetical protein